MLEGRDELEELVVEAAAEAFVGEETFAFGKVGLVDLAVGELFGRRGRQGIFFCRLFCFGFRMDDCHPFVVYGFVLEPHVFADVLFHLLGIRRPL